MKHTVRMTLALLASTCLICAATAAPSRSMMPLPGCYQVDWQSHIVKSTEGRLVSTTRAEIDGATGAYTLVVTPASGAPMTQTQAGRGPHLRDYQPNTPVGRQSNCAMSGNQDLYGGMNFTAICESLRADPGRLTISKAQGLEDKWLISLTTTLTQRIGIEALPAAMRDMRSGAAVAFANARPRTPDERRQIEAARAALARLPQHPASGPIPASGPTMTDVVTITETWTPAGVTCPL